jgi:death-on-curing protein
LTEYLDLADYLLIAEAVLGVPAEEIARWPGIGLAESALHAPAAGFGGVELYPDVIDKAAVLCTRLARNHPLPDDSESRSWRIRSRVGSAASPVTMRSAGLHRLAI